MRSIGPYRLGLNIIVLLAVALSVTIAFAAGSSGGGESSHHDPVVPVLIALILILAGAKLGGELAERVKQPSVLGELLVGILLGNLVLLNPEWDFFGPLRTTKVEVSWAMVVDNLARIGVILLLFEVGLETTVAEMRKVGVSSLLVAVVGVIAPFLLGYGVSYLFVKEVPASIQAIAPAFDVSNVHLFIGATLCATSVGITARVFDDLNRLQTKEAKIILGAAVIDDVLGLIILAIVAGIVTAAERGSTLDTLAIVQTTAIAIAFLGGALAIGHLVIPRTMGLLAKLRTKGIMLISSVLFCFLLAFLADLAGLASIVGAFAAGLILEEVHFREFKDQRSLRELMRPVTMLLVPVFFVVMGIQVRLETFANLDVLGFAAVLSLAAFLGKQVCGLAVLERKVDRLTVGLGMVPRGEVGLIFAGVGRALGVVDDMVFSVVVIMVISTTLITPPFLALSISRFIKKGARSTG